MYPILSWTILYDDLARQSCILGNPELPTYTCYSLKEQVIAKEDIDQMDEYDYAS